MPTATAQPRVQSALTLQGQIVPQNAIDPTSFFLRTRRKRFSEGKTAFPGFGGAPTVVELRKSDILSALHVRFSGSLVVTLPTGTCTPTFRWPYDLLSAVKFVANGQSNLINTSGLKLKFREVAGNPSNEDRGVIQSVSGSNVQQGTMSMSSELWGVGPGTAATASTFPVELYWRIPVAENEKDLSGAIFCQTSATDLTVQLEWNTQAALFTLTGTATATLTGTVSVEAEKYSIPANEGVMIIPDLSLFHSLVQSNSANALAQGDNEPRLVGQGVGRTLLRVFFQTWNGAAPQTPLAVTAANYGPQGWRYGTNETPELFPDGRSLRQWNERIYGSDVGAVWGFLAHEFETTWAFRDSVDQGATSDLRLFINYASALTSPVLEYVQETMFAAGSSA